MIRRRFIILFVPILALIATACGPACKKGYEMACGTSTGVAVDSKGYAVPVVLTHCWCASKESR